MAAETSRKRQEVSRRRRRWFTSSSPLLFIYRCVSIYRQNSLTAHRLAQIFIMVNEKCVIGDADHTFFIHRIYKRGSETACRSFRATLINFMLIAPLFAYLKKKLDRGRLNVYTVGTVNFTIFP